MKVPLTYTGNVVVAGLMLAAFFGVIAATGSRQPTVATVEASAHIEAMDIGPLDTPFDRAAYWLWSLESSCGHDPDWKLVGEDGERGQLQATPIWLDDYERIFGVRPDPMDTRRMLTEYVPNWLWWWSHHRGYRADQVSIETLVQMYQKGP